MQGLVSFDPKADEDESRPEPIVSWIVDLVSVSDPDDGLKTATAFQSPRRIREFKVHVYS